MAEELANETGVVVHHDEDLEAETAGLVCDRILAMLEAVVVVSYSFWPQDGFFLSQRLR
jgi:hypothetical protein